MQHRLIGALQTPAHLQAGTIIPSMGSQMEGPKQQDGVKLDEGKRDGMGGMEAHVFPPPHSLPAGKYGQSCVSLGVALVGG